MNDSPAKAGTVAKPTGPPGPANPPAVPPRPANPPAGPATVSPPGGVATVSQTLFGGKRGGKARADGLVPGSAAAKEADRKKDAERKSAARAATKAANPPPLPAATAPAGGQPYPAADVVNSAGGVPDALVNPVVPWTTKLLAKPARLVTRILERVKKWDIVRRLDKSRLSVEVKRELIKDLDWADEAKEDFATALAECAAIELNQRGVSAANQHWYNLAISGGELVLSHFQLADRIEKAILAANIPTTSQPGTSQPKTTP